MSDEALPAAAPRPCGPLLGHLCQLLRRYLPFSHMAAVDVERFVAAASEAYFAPDECVLRPEDGPVRHLYFIRDGAVSAVRGSDQVEEGGFQYEAGDMFPVAALMARRAVSAVYTATRDTFCLLLPLQAVDELVAASPPFADLLNRRMLNFIDASRQALQSAYASQAFATQSLERRLGELATPAPRTCRPETPLAQALQAMQQHRIGSMLVTDDLGAPAGILTRYDILDRITLPQLPLSTPIAAVMTQPVHTLTVDHTAQDAALLMSRHGLRHVPITSSGRLVGVVSERDLFVMQRLSVRQLSSSIGSVGTVDAMPAVAADLRRLAAALLAQGVQARQLTELISHLNDLLTRRLIELTAARHGLDLARACWLAFGSEGRSEQTIATDQDNGLIFESHDPAADRPAWLAFAREVNAALDACGFPLCKGQVMASNPECCLTPAEWQERFARWIEHGAPRDLLAASIYFDFRPLAGAVALAGPLRDFVTRRAREVPRFCRQLAEDLLRTRAPLDWLGGIDSQTIEGVRAIDLKLHGTAIFVNAARLHCLALGVPEVNTRRRLEAIARARGAPPQHGEAWIGAFEFLQMLRLRVQLEGLAPGDARQHPNAIRLDALNDLDHRILKEAFRVARRLQQRIELDYLR